MHLHLHPARSPDLVDDVGLGEGVQGLQVCHLERIRLAVGVPPHAVAAGREWGGEGE